MLRPMTGARGWGVFNTFVFFWRAPAMFSGRGKTKQGFSCVTLCFMKMHSQVGLYQI